MRGNKYWKQRIMMVKVFFIHWAGHTSTHIEKLDQGRLIVSIVWKTRTGDAMRKASVQMRRLIRITLVWVSLVGKPLVTLVIEIQRSMAMDVMVPEDTRMLVPWMVGTSLQATSPRYHLPP